MKSDFISSRGFKGYLTHYRFTYIIVFLTTLSKGHRLSYMDYSSTWSTGRYEI